MSEFLKCKTKAVRHGLVKLVAPALYDIVAPKYRPMASFLKSRFKDASLVGVEVGVLRGEHAKQLLTCLNLEKLYLVDAYLPFRENDYVATEEETEQNFKIARLNLACFKQPLFYKMLSVDAAKLIPNELDFVYIDATHTYDGVVSDIETWFPKVKDGGVIGGHDFDVNFQSVIKAVVASASLLHAKLYFSCPDWWIVKGELNEGLFS